MSTPLTDQNIQPIGSTVRKRIDDAFKSATVIEKRGRVAEAYGTLIRASGIDASIGEICELNDRESRTSLLAEVVGIARPYTLLTPLGTLAGISSNTDVIATGRKAQVQVSNDLLGRILNAHGEPIDGKPMPEALATVPVYRDTPDPLKRKMINDPFMTGVRAIDGVLTVGEGQRVGIFATAGGGKSTLLGMLARGARADVNVIVLVGERGRELHEFIHDNLGAEGMRKSIVVVATSDKPSLERCRAAYVGTAIAEYFRSQGKRVMLLLDSITRYARALREIGLAIGEPPARRGFPPSVFSQLPLLLERAGNDENGTMTAFYTVLVEDEDEADPIAEEVRSILDGHIVLSRKLAAANHYPAIDVLASTSRVMSRVASKEHLSSAGKLRKLMAKYNELELLIRLGEYKKGQDKEADEAVTASAAIKKFLQQSADNIEDIDQSITALTTTFKM